MNRNKDVKTLFTYSQKPKYPACEAALTKYPPENSKSLPAAD